MRGISWLAEEPLAYQEGLYFTEIVNWVYFSNWLKYNIIGINFKNEAFVLLRLQRNTSSRTTYIPFTWSVTMSQYVWKGTVFILEYVNCSYSSGILFH